MIGDWGEDSERTFGVRESEAATPVETESNDPADLPRARAARAGGFQAVPDGLQWSFLPAVWPAGARA